MCDQPEDNEASVMDLDAACSQAPKVTARRPFLGAMGAALVALVTFPATLVRAKKMKLDLAKAAELATPGGSRVIKVRGTEILLVRDSATTVRAINNTCTHKNCKVKYKQDSNDLFCKCHKSAFKLDGTVVAGPAPRPLTTYNATLAGDKVMLDLPD